MSIQSIDERLKYIHTAVYAYNFVQFYNITRIKRFPLTGKARKNLKLNNSCVLLMNKRWSIPITKYSPKIKLKKKRNRK